jgi:precorrin-3B synthase
MMSFTVRGWCPTALRPMLSGDGFLVRVRPREGRLTSAQASRLAKLATTLGNGLIDLTGRANLQIRGVRERDRQALAAALDRLSLVDADGEREAQRNILVAPYWREGDCTQLLAAELECALAAASVGLPEKFGFAIDCGQMRVLAQAPADIRIERGAQGGLIVRADGAQEGCAVAQEEAVPTALALAKWFATSAQRRGRMATHIAGGAKLPRAMAGSARPAPEMDTPCPGVVVGGTLVAFAFGQLQSETLALLATLAPGLRMTPWRMLLIEGLYEVPQLDGVLTRPDDALLRVTACTGAPGCPEAQADTRRLATALAAHIPADARLHVSGCAKGCAHPLPSSVTLVGTANGFDLVRDGCARDVPDMYGLYPAQILAKIGALWGGH